jgi:hypothetical protein
MESDSGYHEKMDALDLIMNALKDHEKQLDEISHRLEQAFKEVTTRKPSTIEVAPEAQRREAPPRKRTPQVIFNKWNEFKDTSQDATMVAFEVEGNLFQVYAMVDDGVFTYEETLLHTTFKVVEEPSRFTIDKDFINNIDAIQFLLEGKLKCGLILSIKSSKIPLTEREYLFELRYDFKSDKVKEFLSRELEVSKDNIVEGKITY